MTNSDIMKQIITFARRQRGARLVFSVSAWLIFLVFLGWTISTSYRDYTLGSGGFLGVFWESISTGTLFTRSDLFFVPSDKYFSSNSDLIINLVGMTAVLFVAVFILIGLVLAVVAIYMFFIAGPDGKEVTNKYVKLLWRYTPGQGFACTVDKTDFHIYVVGKSLIAIEDTKLPEFLANPTKIDSFRREKMKLRFDQKDEFATDNTTADHFKIFTDSKSQPQMVKFLDKELRAFMNKQLADNIVASDGQSLAFIMDSLAIKDTAKLYRKLQVFAEFSRLAKKKRPASIKTAPLQVKPRPIAAWPFKLNLPLYASWLIILAVCVLVLVAVAVKPGVVDIARLQLLTSGFLMLILIRKLQQYANGVGL